MPAYRKKKSGKSFKKKAPKGRPYARSSGFRNRAPRASRGFFNRAGELKYSDLASASYTCDTTGTVTALNLTAVGDDNTTRDGRQIFNKSIQVQGYIEPFDTQTVPSFVRVMLVWDSQPNSGAIATITNILTASTSLSNLNLDNRERFTVLRDFKAPLGSYNTTAGQTYAMTPNTHKIDWFVPLNMITTYSGTTAAIGSVATGALLMVTIGSQAATDAGKLTATTRLRFSDN